MKSCAIVAVEGIDPLNNAGAVSVMAAVSELQLHHKCIFAGLRELYSESCTGVSLFTGLTPSQARSFFAIRPAKWSAEVKSFNNGGTHNAHKIHPDGSRRTGGDTPETRQRMLQNGSRNQNSRRAPKPEYNTGLLRRSIGRADLLAGKAVIPALTRGVR